MATDLIDGRQVRWFRIAFGCLMAIATLRFFAHGWIDEYFLAPKHFLHYRGFAWVKPWPGPGMYLHFAAMFALAIGIVVGYRTRLCAALFGALFAYAHLIDKTNYLNHYFLVIYLCALIALLPIHGTTIPRWALWVLRAQIGLVYVFGGIAKLSPDWLVDAQPLKIWLSANTDFPVLGPYLAEPWAAHVAAVLGCAFDLLIVPALLWSRTRRYAFAAVAMFHLATASLFQIGMFPWIMIASSILWLPPTSVVSITEPVRRVPRWLVPWFAIQLLVPLRHFVYPGNMLWTEEGFRFSWNVMVMEKQGTVEFHVTDPSTGRRYDVSPTDYLTPYQARMMGPQPDEILELAHVIADDFRARGIANPEVRVDAFASLNGRPASRLIDPAVDLAAETDGFAPKSWILPSP